MRRLEANKTWVPVKQSDVPREHRILPTKFIFKTKLNVDGSVERHKARLVALGCLQREGLDYKEVYAPVAHITTWRTIIAVAAALNLQPQLMDVTTAFLQSDNIQEEVLPELRAEGSS